MIMRPRGMVARVLLASAWLLGAPSASRAASFTLTSPDWSPERPIGPAYVYDRAGCTGGNVSPALAWTGVPAHAASLLLTIRDPDAPGGDFWHWVLADIPPTTTMLPRGAHGVGREGKTGWGARFYGGPCPPEGETHHYVVELRALDLAHLPEVAEPALERDLRGHVLGSATLTALYRAAP